MLDLRSLVHNAVLCQELLGLGHNLAVHILLGLLTGNEVLEELVVLLGLGDERLGKSLRDPMQTSSLVEAPVVHNNCVDNCNLVLDPELAGLPLGVLATREVTLEDNRLLASTGSLQLASIAPTQQHLRGLADDVEGLRL